MVVKILMFNKSIYLGMCGILIIVLAYDYIFTLMFIKLCVILYL